MTDAVPERAAAPNANVGAPEIRAIRPAEADRLGALIVDAYRRVTGAPEEPAYEDELRDVATRARESTVLVALVDGDVVGGVTYVSGPEDPYAELLSAGEAGIRMLAVDPSVQGHGIGRALVQACIDRAQQAGCRRVVLHTTPWMTRAQHLYEDIGFRRVPDIDWQPLPEVPLLGYAIDLTPAG